MSGALYTNHNQIQFYETNNRNPGGRYASAVNHSADSQLLG